jgi:hypothetical protein
MKLNAFLTSLAKKTGLDLTKPEFKDALSSEIEIPDAMATTIETGLMNEEAAKNNSRIRSAIKAEVYNGVDSDVNSVIEELGLDDDAKTTVLSEKKSIDRIKKLASHLTEQSKKAAKEGDKTQADALKKQVQELNDQIKTIKQTSQQQIDQLKADNENSLIGFNVKALLGTKQFVLPDAMSPAEKVEMVYSILNNELSNKGLKLIRENGNLKLQKTDGTEAYDDKNNKLELPSFIDGALAQRGLLKVSDPKQGQQGNGGAPGNVTGGGQLPANYQQQISALDKEIAGELA